MSKLANRSELLPDNPLTVWKRMGSKRIRLGLLIAWRRLRRVRVKLQVPPLRYPGFPVQLSGVGQLRAAFCESRIRHRGRYRDVGNTGPLPSG
jgi:hypothetical protein